MGRLFKNGCSRRDLIAERTEDWQRTTPEGVLVKTTCLAHCYRGGVFLRRALDGLGSILHEGRRRSPTIRALDRMRCVPKPEGGWLGLQGHGRVDGAVLLFVPAQVPLRSCRSRSSAATPSGGRRYAAITIDRLRNGEVGLQSRRHRKRQRDQPTSMKERKRMTDPTESIRRQMVTEINAEPGSRETSKRSTAKFGTRLNSSGISRRWGFSHRSSWSVADRMACVAV